MAENPIESLYNKIRSKSLTTGIKLVVDQTINEIIDAIENLPRALSDLSDNLVDSVPEFMKKYNDYYNKCISQNGQQMESYCRFYASYHASKDIGNQMYEKFVKDLFK
ncbi:MAG: hypothetical protein ACP5G1_04010 [Nanopusillaceae archaeon]